VSSSHLAESPLDMAALIRNEPVQARSAARLMALLDAAAAVIDEIGYERLTTAMVADRAGASIGTVYRYFPDRIAVLQSLAARNAERLTDAALALVADPANESWDQVVAALFANYANFFRTEPGFASLRLGDVLDLRPLTGSPSNAVYAHRILEAMCARFGVESSPDRVVAAEGSFIVADALIARAFARDAQGYAPFLEQAERVGRGFYTVD